MLLHRRRSARVFACSLIAGSMLALLPTGASASAPGDVCAEFPHTQTYLAGVGLFRAPAWHYGGPVTIVYDADDCSSNDGRPQTFSLSVSGNATVYRGLFAEGEPLDVKPFTSTLRYDSDDGAAEWPIRWWSCEKADFTYVWSIDDVYRFAMTADDGEWTMGQRDLATDGLSSGTSIDACRRR